MPDLRDARRLLHDAFGLAEFRPGQEAVIGALLDGRSALAVFPTGGGKSLCYQLPALLMEGLTVVVSPLIALMKDQVDDLRRRGIAAARLDSTLEADEARAVMAGVREGSIKLLYVAPERLASERSVEFLSRREVALLAVDEAHCISEWGHNFRPEYLKLARLAERLHARRILALTATATPEVARDIARAFGIASEDVVITGFHRPNLELHATPCTADARPAALLSALRSAPPGPAIVYVTLQKTAEEVAASLRDAGLDARAYHAGMDDGERHRVQDEFMGSTAGVVVATIAFGMGIDKADIRAVVHYNLPKSLENYAQEVGRAGRDGRPARCELIACPDDLVTLENFTFGDTPDEGAIASLIDDVLGRGDPFDVALYELSQEHDVRPLVVATLLTYLELEGLIEGIGPFFTEFKVQPLRPIGEILGQFRGERAEFLARLFGRARKGRTWLTFDVPALSAELGEPRDRISKALNYLEEKADITLKPSGTRQAYRMGAVPFDPAELVPRLAGRFARREQRDVERLDRVVTYAQETGCLTARLLSYFGEELPGPCGHCGPCLGRPPGPLPPRRVRAIGPGERARLAELMAERHGALATPRQRARFLCGLSSPATTRARLTRHSLFGALADVPFAAVLAFAGEQG